MPTYTPDEFADILIAAPVKAVREIVKVTKKGSLNVKNAARASVKQTAPVQNAHAYTAINYDVTAEGQTVTGEIGYDKDVGASDGKKGPGAIGNLLEFGGGGDHSPPHHDLRLSLEAEDPRFTQAIGDAGEQAIE